MNVRFFVQYFTAANIFHRDLKPKNILANSDCKLKICDFGLARVTLNGASSAMFWTDYVATRWYRAPELCGSFYTKYTTAIDIWSIGCIFAEVLTRQPLFPGKNVAHQLDLITDLLGTPSPDVIARIRNEKARKYLSAMRKKPPAQFQHKFPNVHPQAVRLLRRLLAFDAADRPTAEEALADPYFKDLARIDREPSCQPAPKEELEFEKKHLTKDDIRSLIYQEILEYHPQAMHNYASSRISSFPIPSAVERLRQQFDLAQRQVKGPAEVVPSGGRASLSRDHDQQCIQPNWNAGNRPLLGPHKVVPGDSLKVNMVSGSFTHTVDSEKHEQSNVKRLMKNASFGLFQKVGSQHSQLKAQHRPEQAIRKESNYERVPVIRSQVKAQHRKDQANRKESNHEKAPVASRSRSMGSTVARLVAAFSGQSIYS
ncbi:hypothetical protein KP509_31G026700 [Ceratopteris richardii]|uniref:Protein kinase domain-containing protein n=1 Tax=Ceratopteris richardii TaxID=49495 RepID=A0A8T2QWS1_CERRI|nr:hypothetical protein KP509_31G026700 [Ceratopteris richardii]